MLAVTLGDVAGIGPEIVARTLLADPDLRETCVPIVVACSHDQGHAPCTAVHGDDGGAVTAAVS